MLQCRPHRFFILLTTLLLCSTASALVYEDKWTAAYGCCTFTPEGIYYPTAEQACKAALKMVWGTSEGKRCVVSLFRFLGGRSATEQNSGPPEA